MCNISRWRELPRCTPVVRHIFHPPSPRLLPSLNKKSWRIRVVKIDRIFETNAFLLSPLEASDKRGYKRRIRMEIDDIEERENETIQIRGCKNDVAICQYHSLPSFFLVARYTDSIQKFVPFEYRFLPKFILSLQLLTYRPRNVAFVNYWVAI